MESDKIRELGKTKTDKEEFYAYFPKKEVYNENHDLIRSPY